MREKTPTSLDLPLSAAFKRTLGYAGEEAARLAHPFIGGEHLLLGLLHEQGSLAAQLLQQHGLTLTQARRIVHEHRSEAGRGPRPGIGSSMGSWAKLAFGMPIPSVRCADLAASVRFYTALNFHLLSTPTPDRLIVLASGPFYLVLFHQSLGASLLCFTASDLSKLTFHLESTGHILEQPYNSAANDNSSLLIRDPDGNLVLLVSQPDSLAGT